jgi:hypothetical protein
MGAYKYADNLGAEWTVIKALNWTREYYNGRGRVYQNPSRTLSRILTDFSVVSRPESGSTSGFA